MAYGKSPLAAAGFRFFGFSAALPCKVGRLLFRLVGCYFDGVAAFQGSLRIPRILTEL